MPPFTHAPAPDPSEWEHRLPAPQAREAALYAKLSALGIAWRTHAHTPVFTVEEARNLRGSLPGTHTKNLFLVDKRRNLWLVVAREELRVDLNALAKLLGAQRFSFAKPELLVEALGIAPGAVTPFALMNDSQARVTVVLDRTMMEAGILNFHPLRNDRTTAIAGPDLIRFLEACGQPPRTTVLPERAL